MYCNGASDQVDPPCPTVCTDDEDCDAGAHCESEICVAYAGVGQSCTDVGDCGGPNGAAGGQGDLSAPVGSPGY